MPIWIYIFPCSRFTFFESRPSVGLYNMQLFRHTAGFWFLENILEAYWQCYWWDLFGIKSFKWNETKLLNRLHFISESAQIWLTRDLLWFQPIIKWGIIQSNIHKDYWHQQELQQLHLVGMVPEKITYGQVARLWNHESGDIQPLFLHLALTHSLTASGPHFLTATWEQTKTFLQSPAVLWKWMGTTNIIFEVQESRHFWQSQLIQNSIARISIPLTIM